MLDASPYLSDIVIIQAIYKEDVLPKAIILDVTFANPQCAKSDEILNTLDSVIAFLENETDLDSRYDLALAQLNNSDQAGA